MIGAFVSCRSWSETCLFLIQDIRDSFDNIHSFYQWLDLKKKNLYYPSSGCRRKYFCRCGSGSNCNSTTNVVRVALILGYPLPHKADESTIFSWIVYTLPFLTCILITPSVQLWLSLFKDDEAGAGDSLLKVKLGLRSARLKPFITSRKEVFQPKWNTVAQRTVSG